MRLPPSSRIRAVTLIELLSVMAVLVIVAGFLVPAVASLGRSTALVTGGNMVTNLANFARQSAVSKNTMTALVLLGGQGTPEDYRSFIVLEYIAGGGGWSPLSAWQTLPDGITVDFADAANCTFYEKSPAAFPLLAGPPVQKNPPVTYKTAQVGASAFSARIYLPTGGLQSPEKPAQIRLVEGFAQGAQLVRTHPDGTGKSANYYDIAIVGATGTTKISRP